MMADVWVAAGASRGVAIALSYLRFVPVQRASVSLDTRIVAEARVVSWTALLARISGHTVVALNLQPAMLYMELGHELFEHVVRFSH